MTWYTHITLMGGCTVFRISFVLGILRSQNGSAWKKVLSSVRVSMNFGWKGMVNDDVLGSWA